MSNVFISYSKEDASVALMIAEALERWGCSVWWDRHIPPGKTWDEVIGHSLETADCVLVLWSRISVASRWVREEAERGADRGCLIPVLVETINPPLGFGRIQAADLSAWRGDEKDPKFENLRAAVMDQIRAAGGEMAPANPGSAVQTMKKTPARQKNRSKLFWIAGGFAVVVATAGVYIAQVWSPMKRIVPPEKSPLVRPAAPSSGGPQKPLAMARTGHNTTIVAVQGPDNSLEFYWNQDGEPQWHPSVIAGPGTIDAAPAIARTGDNNTIVAVQGPGNSLTSFWNNDGDPQWRPSPIAGQGTAYSAPAIARTGHTNVIAVRGPNNSLNIYWNRDRDSKWNQMVNTALETTYSSPAMTRVGNGVQIAVEGPNNSLDFYWNNDGDPQWRPSVIAGPGTTYSAPAMAHTGHRSMVLAVEGPNNSLDFYWNNDGDPQWRPSVIAGPGTTYSAPAMTRAGHTNLVAAQGPNNSLNFYWNNDGDPQWHLSVVAGPGTTYAAPAVAAGDNRAFIAVQDSNYNPHLYSIVDGSHSQ
jgi:hypothetical protein